MFNLILAKRNYFSYYMGMNLTLWVDADSVPKNLRSIILKASVRINAQAYFVSDRNLSDVQLFIEEDTHRIRSEKKAQGIIEKAQLKAYISLIHQIVVPTGKDSADNYIVENSTIPALCITHDIPLAFRMLEKGAFAIDDRGESYTKENIKARLGNRTINQQLREFGVFEEQQSKMKESSTKAFADNLDRTLTLILKQLDQS